MARAFFTPPVHPLEKAADDLIKKNVPYSERYAGLVKTTRQMLEDECEQKRNEILFNRIRYFDDELGAEDMLSWKPEPSAQLLLFDVADVLPSAGLTEPEQKIIELVMAGCSATYEAPSILGKSKTACVQAYNRAVEKLKKL